MSREQASASVSISKPRTTRLGKLGAAAMIVASIVATSTNGAGAALSANERFTIVATPPAPDQIVAAGIINDVGTAASVFHPGGGGSFTITGTWTFRRGQMYVVAEGATTSEDVNTTACVRRERTDGTFTIASGDGDYAAVTGSGTFHALNLFLGTRTEQGCSFVGLRPYQVVKFTADLAVAS